MAQIRLPWRRLITEPDKSLEIKVCVKNIGGAFWPAQTPAGRRTVRLGAQLYDDQKELVNRDFARVFLPHDLTGSMKTTVLISLPPVDQPGDYWLKFDMVSEGIDWFESAGSQPVWRRFRIRPQ